MESLAGDYVLVTEWGELGGAGIAKIDPATDQIVGRLSMPGSPRHIDADTARRLTYVSQHYGNKISVIKADSLVSADLVIPGLGLAPIGVMLTPDGTRLLVATRGNDGVYSPDDRLDVVSLDYSTWPPTAAMVTSIPTGLHPIQAFVDHTGHYAVVTVRNQPAILVIDLNTYQVVWQAPGLPLTAEPEGGCLHPTQNIVYVALHGMNTLEVLDLDSMKILRHVPIINPGGGPPQPSAVRFTPDGSRAYVSAQTAGRILMFNTSNPRVPVQDTSVHLPTGPQPHEIVWLPNNRAYVANTNNMQQYGSVSIISNYNAVPSISAPILTDLAGPLSFAYFKSFPPPPTARPLCVVIMTHVEGDQGQAEGDPSCPTSVFYQSLPLPAPGAQPPGPMFAIDVAGTEIIREVFQNYTDSYGSQPKLFIEPTGEFWQTEADPPYGGKLFGTYDYQALGYEFGIQGHAIYYSGTNFCWYNSPHTADGVLRKLTDLHTAAQTLLRNGQPVNGGATFTGGWKLEKTALGDSAAEYIIDHAAAGLGYRISFEDHDAHIQSEPPGINNSRASYYVYRAVYGDGVQMIEIDFNGGVNAACSGNTPRCETPYEAITRFDNTVAAMNADPDTTHVYCFAFTTHSNGIWDDYNRVAGGLPMVGEGAGLLTLMDSIQARTNGGTTIKYVTPIELAATFEALNPPPPPAKPPVHLTVISHNEEPLGGRPDYTVNISYYLSNRKLVKQLAETITSRGGKYNFQSDWNYLKAVAMFDTGSVTANTNGKNIVRWMKEDLGVEVDPHAHETQYSYADVAYLIQQLGVTPTNNVGGFLYDPPDNPQGWEKHEAGVFGVMYPSYFWRADNLWGAATYQHQGNDDVSSGIWRPKDRYNFYVDDTTQRLAYIGGGCGGLPGLVQLVDDIQTGKAPASGFYTANLMMIQDWMDSGSIAMLGASIDSLAPSVAQGRIQWSTLSQTANAWKTQYGSKASRYACDTTTTPPTTFQIEAVEAWVTAPNGNQVYTRIVRPVLALYPGRRFPALVAIPGGTGAGAPLADNPDYRNLAGSGFVVVVFNPEGRGTGTPGNLISQGIEDCNGFDHQNDLKAVVEYTAGLIDVDSANIGVQTSSLGIAIGAGALGRYPDLPVKYLVDVEGPHDNRVITFYDAGHEIPVCGHLSTVTDPSPENVAFWTEREAVRYIGGFRGHFLRMQAQLDHAQNPYYFRHTIEMINAGTNSAYGGAGQNCWTRVNGSDLGNPINKVYLYGDTTHYPQWESGKLSTDHPGLQYTYIKEMSAMALTACVYDVVDLIALINYVFVNATVPPPDPGCIYITNGDMDCNGVANVSDVLQMINFIFLNGKGPCETCGG